MKQETRHITVEETEQLCRLYMDCQLSVLEETELEYMLMQSKLDSPLINETRVLMGMSRSVNLQAKKKHLLMTWGWRTAACIAILTCCVALLWNHIISKTEPIAYMESTEISVDKTKDIAKSEATKKEPQDRPSTLSIKHSKRKTGKVRQKPSDMTTPQNEPPIIAETTTTVTEPTMPSTHIAPEHVVYIINGERQVPTPDMPSINDLRLRGQRLTTEVRRQIQEPIGF